jgi:hypothetical protein
MESNNVVVVVVITHFTIPSFVEISRSPPNSPPKLHKHFLTCSSNLCSGAALDLHRTRDIQWGHERLNQLDLFRWR